MPWSTKETPGNEKTKGSIKFKRCKLTIDLEDNTATISPLGIMDAWLKHPERRAGRIILNQGTDLHKALKANEYEHSPLKEVIGSCGSRWAICDIRDEHELTMIALRFANQFRVLAPNERYYIDYDTKRHIYDYDEYDDEDDD